MSDRQTCELAHGCYGICAECPSDEDMAQARIDREHREWAAQQERDYYASLEAEAKEAPND